MKDFPVNLETLTLLQRLHLINFLYENTQMHYTAEHLVDVTPDGLFQRMVVEKKGSWCFGQNSLFLGMIQGLGFRAYSGGARVNMNMDAETPPQYTPLSHMIIFVQPTTESNVTYLVDTGFGGSNPTRPILLSDASDYVVIGSTPTEEHRLTRGTRDDSTLELQPNSPQATNIEWRLEVRHNKPNPQASTDKSDLMSSSSFWRILYAFSENEFFPADIESESFVVSTRPVGLFNAKVICLKNFWLSRDEMLASGGTPAHGTQSIPVAERYMGRITLEGREIKRHIGSQTERVATVRTEDERVKALREIFGLVIAESDVIHIQGRKAAI